jgi:hypothetical protein
MSSRSLLYSYCVIDFEEQRERALPPDERDKLSSLGFGNVFFIKYRDLALVASKVLESEFGQENVDKMSKDLLWLAQNSEKHEQVVEYFMQSSTTLVPLKFCTIFASTERAQKMLEKNYERFRDLLEKFCGKAEYGVSLYRRIGIRRTPLLRTARSPKKLLELKEEISRATPGKAYFLRKQFDELLASEIEKENSRIRSTIYEKFSKLSCEAKLTSRVSLGSRASNDQSMLLNASFLVPLQNFKKFQAAYLKEKKELAKHNMRLSLSGPWPPYNFC